MNGNIYTTIILGALIGCAEVNQTEASDDQPLNFIEITQSDGYLRGVISYTNNTSKPLCFVSSWVQNPFIEIIRTSDLAQAVKGWHITTPSNSTEPRLRLSQIAAGTTMTTDFEIELDEYGFPKPNGEMDPIHVGTYDLGTSLFTYYCSKLDNISVTPEIGPVPTRENREGNGFYSGATTEILIGEL